MKLGDVSGFFKGQMNELKQGTHILSANTSVSRQSLYYGVRNAKIAGDVKVAENLTDKSLKTMGISKKELANAEEYSLARSLSNPNTNMKEDYSDYLSTTYRNKSENMLRSGMDRTYKGTVNSLKNIAKDEGVMGLLNTAKRYYTEEGLKTGVIRGGVAAAAIATPITAFNALTNRD